MCIFVTLARHHYWCCCWAGHLCLLLLLLHRLHSNCHMAMSKCNLLCCMDGIALFYIIKVDYFNSRAEIFNYKKTISLSSNDKKITIYITCLTFGTHAQSNWTALNTKTLSSYLMPSVCHYFHRHHENGIRIAAESHNDNNERILQLVILLYVISLCISIYRSILMARTLKNVLGAMLHYSLLIYEQNHSSNSNNSAIVDAVIVIAIVAVE